MKRILLFFLVYFSCQVCYGADINWSLTGTASGSGGTVGTPANIKDDDTGTAYGDVCSTDAYCTWSYSNEVEFAESADVINKAEIYHHKGGSIVGPQSGFGGYWYVDLYYSAAWHNVMSGSWSSTVATVTESNSTGWVDVTKIRLRGDGSANGGPWQFPTYSRHNTFELRAWGPANAAGNYAYIY